MARRKKKTLPKTQQKRGCANVLVDRDDVLEGGKVPKGCRFVTGGDVRCTPAVAERIGAIRVERTKPVESRIAKKKSSKKSSSKTGKHCYSENSRLPYLKKRSKTGKKVLKKGCRKDKKTGKICCDRKQSRPRRASGVNGLDMAEGLDGASVDGLDLSQFAMPSMEHIQGALADADFDPRALEALGQRSLREAGPSLALLDDGDLDLPAHSELAMIDDADGLALGPPSDALPQQSKPHLDSFGDFAMVWAGGTVIAGAGVWGTYAALDNIDYFDDKPVGRAAMFVGVGAAGAGLGWWLADGMKYGAEIRTIAAGFGITLSAVGVLGLIRTLLEKQAANTTDADARKRAEDWAENIPYVEWSPPDPTEDTGGGDDGETQAEGGESGGTSSAYRGNYPSPGRSTGRDRRASARYR